ncbi:MAG: YeeE/YedE family protein [Rhodospirillales bacterium 20-60-12]|nr:MAG: YeeE/YedE family protein [Rhodospirillales bacterium 20-60-12]HQT68586.1 YeeE/YedE thiosulfate transporter family protein [Acetobacteraceae bacterium]HQU02700.1 YeeE/YedE thiosulfate transporter family protein [Acetobacteraceae bacterium]
MTEFTPFQSALGGAIIGFSALWLWLSLGRIAGISGILGSVVSGAPRERHWRMAFLVGLMGTPLIATAIGLAPSLHFPVTSPPVLIAAGLLVGFGTRLGSGCTSGHGICGISRLSPRSIAATLTFMAVAFVMVFFTHHLITGFGV